ncbi:MAG: penicillin acylase family protein, partial [Anaerolineae bacterium]|nr:penicillin acylase family protein [Anaerolineae bacterium]
MFRPRDRWWQMEWARRLGLGRLAELGGRAALPQDIFIRSLDIPTRARRDVERLTPAEADELAAFCAGVNAYLAGKDPNDIAPEYGLLAMLGVQATPEPWEPLHTLVFAYVMQAVLSLNSVVYKLLRAGYEAHGGPALAEMLLPDYDFERMPLIMQPGWLPSPAPLPPLPAVPLPDLSGMRAEFLKIISTLGGGGSNNWVLSGTRTESGAPLLANDPHLAIQIPVIWYAVGLHGTSDACPYDVVGLTFPQYPLIVVGHNARIGWGVTNVGTDIAELFALERHPQDAGQVFHNGAWQALQTVTEEILVAGEGAYTLTRQRSPFGPLVQDVLKLDQPYALQWGSDQPNRLLTAVDLLCQAQDWEQFQHALTFWDAPAQNFVYADVDGNIGYVCSGAIPDRPTNGRLPVPGVDDSARWAGMLDPRHNPRLLNPAAGFIASANNAVLHPADFPQPIAQQWDYGYRAARIEALIQATEKHTLATCAAIQHDDFSPLAG